MISNLVFEITETAAVTNLKDARSLMDAVRAKHCRFALDDFGVGFSSFNYVKELPVDLVKIDGAFITGLAERRDSQVVVNQMRGEFSVHSPALLRLHARARVAVAALDEVELVHVPRLRNRLADALANEAADGEGETG